MDKYSYAREKLGHAVFLLATGKGDVRSRLRDTYYHLKVLQSHHMPEDMKDDIQWVKKEIVKHGPLLDKWGDPISDAVDHTMSRIRNHTGKKIAEKIYSMYLNLPSRQPQILGER